jgi:hypothetical protein
MLVLQQVDLIAQFNDDGLIRYTGDIVRKKGEKKKKRNFNFMIQS